MTEQSTWLTLLLVRLDTDHPQMSADTCRWTAADADGIFADADAKISASTVRTSL